MPFALLFCLAALYSCAAERQPGELFGPAEEDLLVVDGLLFVGKPLADIFVRRTVDPGQPYNRQRASVNDARVVVRQGDQVFAYSADPDSAGRYLPPPWAPLVAPETLYRVEVDAGGKQLRAQTLTPPAIAIREAVLLDESTLDEIRRFRLFSQIGDSVYSAPENQVDYLEGLVEARINPVDVPAFQIGVFSLDPDSDFVIDADFLEEDDYEEFEREGSSPPLEFSEGNVRMPWFVIAFSGRYLIRVNALDQNWYDYIRTSPDEDGGPNGGGLAGDNFDRPQFNVEGGIGLFGSAAVDSLGFFVLPTAE